MADINPFSSASALPAYGSNSCVLRWRMNPGFESWGVLIYRRKDDGAPFELLNPGDEPVFAAEFVDLDLRSSDELDRVWYKLAAEKEDGTILDGPEIGFFETLTLPDLRAARRMFSAELQRLRSGGALPAWLVPASRNSKKNEGLYPSAGIVSNVCLYREQGGMPTVPFAGGMWQTWVQLLNVSMVRKQGQDGLAEDQSLDASARLPGHPLPDRGSIIILPNSDDRYVVGDSIQPFYYAGIVPIAYQVSLQRIARSDARYKVVTPPLEPRLASPKFRPLA